MKNSVHSNFLETKKPTVGSVVRASGCQTEKSRYFDSGRTNTLGLRITEEKVSTL